MTYDGSIGVALSTQNEMKNQRRPKSGHFTSPVYYNLASITYTMYLTTLNIIVLYTNKNHMGERISSTTQLKTL